MAIQNGDMIKKHNVALFVRNNDAVEWVQIKKSTDNTITPNAETREFDFIVDEAPTTVVEKLKHTLSQPITMFKGEKDFDFFYNRFLNQATGAQATGEMLIAFNQIGSDAIDGWFSKATFIIDNFNPVESIITVNIELSGTTQIGTVAIDGGNPVFTGNETKQKSIKFAVLDDGNAPITGALVSIGGVEKITDDNGLTDAYILEDEKEYSVMVIAEGYTSYAEKVNTNIANDGVIEIVLGV